MNDPQNQSTTFAAIYPIGSRGHVYEADRIMRWNILPDGDARIDKAGVASIDQMVAALISISNGWCADSCGVARRALWIENDE
jgi:hypothetical protein